MPVRHRDELKQRHPNQKGQRLPQQMKPGGIHILDLKLEIGDDAGIRRQVERSLTTGSFTINLSTISFELFAQYHQTLPNGPGSPELIITKLPKNHPNVAPGTGEGKSKPRAFCPRKISSKHPIFCYVSLDDARGNHRPCAHTARDAGWPRGKHRPDA